MCAELGCDKPVDIYRDHCVSCKHGPAMIARHDNLTCEMARLCQFANLKTHIEKRIGFHDRAHPYDLLIAWPPSDAGFSLGLDFGVTATNICNRNSETAVDHYFKEKMLSIPGRKGIMEGVRYLAMICSVNGSWQAESLKLINEIAAHCSAVNGWDLATTKDLFLTRLSVALQRGNGQLLLSHRTFQSAQPFSYLDI